MKKISTVAIAHQFSVTGMTSAKELGYCSSTEVRDGEQWVCLSGSWEKWSDAMARGYSLEYLKKVLKRNKRS